VTPTAAVVAGPPAARGGIFAGPDRRAKLSSAANSAIVGLVTRPTRILSLVSSVCLACLVSLAMAAGCGGSESGPDADADLAPLGANTVQGSIEFTFEAEGIRVEADITGLTPGKHGMHIHEWGDCSAPDGMSAGGHFNPDTVDHGAPGNGVHHPGDFGNLDADADGNATLSIVIDPATFTMTEGDKKNILGRGVIVHEKADDYGQPTGNAGGRLACGVINVAGGSSPPVKNPMPAEM
jgi:Cu-Zn family superoxide dismutase